ncbi:glycosyltransferase family 39 protein [Hellea balneolensis]|uniref:glycosyltransferase family 39 protein n=1 Tax=Hellea balneolensis TaxID=287478 RepID=UPI00040AFB9C|nr:glycosyltransferase family 39 protein [Hellea balneolensis]
MLKTRLKNISAKSWLAWSVIGFIAVFFAYSVFGSYPLNVGAFDNPNYIKMILNGESNLIHAPGYPVILHTISSVFLDIPAFNDRFNAEWLSSLKTAQVVLHFILFIISVFLAYKTFDGKVAAIFALFWGTSFLFLGNVNASAPEWLEGHFIVMSLLLVIFSQKQMSRRKFLTLTLAGFIFSVGYLVKYNALTVLPVIVAYLFLGAIDIRKIFKSVLPVTKTLVIFLLPAFLLVASFKHFYHVKTTETTKLSLDHAWVLTTSLPPHYFKNKPEEMNEIALRFTALIAVTPPDYFRAGAHHDISYGIKGPEKAQYDALFEKIMDTPRDELIALIRQNGIPEKISNFTSSVPMNYYYGLERTDKLGIRLFLEAIFKDTGPVVEYAFLKFDRYLIQAFTLRQLPTFEKPLRLELSPKTDNPNNVSLIYPEAPAQPWFFPYYNPEVQIKSFGPQFIDKTAKVTHHLPLWVILTLLAAFGIIIDAIKSRRLKGCLVMLSVMSFACASFLLLGIRSKEAIAISPTYFLFLAIGLVFIYNLVKEILKRFKKRPVPKVSK